MGDLARAVLGVVQPPCIHHAAELTYIEGDVTVGTTGVLSVPLAAADGTEHLLQMSPGVAELLVTAVTAVLTELGLGGTPPPDTRADRIRPGIGKPQAAPITEGDSSRDTHRLRIVDLDDPGLRSALTTAVQDRWDAEASPPAADMAADAALEVIEAGPTADPAPEGLREDLAAHLRGRILATARSSPGAQHGGEAGVVNEYDLADSVLPVLDAALHRQQWTAQALLRVTPHDFERITQDRAHLRRTWAALGACLLKQARHEDLTADDLADLPQAHAAILRGHDATRREAARLHQLAEKLREERDLAVAHDRQPYPTADAYEKACTALEAHRARADRAEEELAGARASIEHMTKAMSWICGHDRQGLDHLAEAQREARGREAAVRQARAWARIARAVEAELASIAHRTQKES
ncbi:hypothetical protein [Streptomyces sp. C10-9-1]|uniref:hypothetical protein n=1 Tax=Streptomyces sp. C10-9-1 TaxID=1859285 RepID=UPI003F49D42A